MFKLLRGLCVCLVCFLIWLGYSIFYKNIPQVSKENILVVTPGETFRQISKNIAIQTSTNQKLIYYCAILFNLDHQIQAGVYNLQANLTLWQLLKKLETGEIATYKFTIVEGWGFKQTQAALDKNNIRHTIPNISSASLAKLLKIKHSNIEGWLYPETYYYNDNSTDFEIYKQAFDKMQKILNKAWSNRQKGLSYQNPYQALIVASLIERETRYIEEYNKIAAVILNRLAKNMRLQIDAAVLYGLEKTSGPLTKNDLLKNTPYNLYKHKGLPPTPISMPAKPAIIAALHPESSKNLYYVLSADARHIFSTNYQDHLIAVKKLRQHQATEGK